MEIPMGDFKIRKACILRTSWQQPINFTIIAFNQSRVFSFFFLKKIHHPDHPGGLGTAFVPTWRGYHLPWWYIYMGRHHTIYMKPSWHHRQVIWLTGLNLEEMTMKALSAFHLAMAQLQLACVAEHPRRSWCVSSWWSQGNQISSSLCRKLFQQLSTLRLWTACFSGTSIQF